MSKAKNTRKGRASTKRVSRTAETFSADARLKRVGGKVYDLSSYKPAKTANGNTSLNCGDATAKALAGLELDDVYKKAAKATGIPEKALRAKYAHLNVGMQRMNLGNRMRAA